MPSMPGKWPIRKYHLEMSARIPKGSHWPEMEGWKRWMEKEKKREIRLNDRGTVRRPRRRSVGWNPWFGWRVGSPVGVGVWIITQQKVDLLLDLKLVSMNKEIINKCEWTLKNAINNKKYNSIILLSINNINIIMLTFLCVEQLH